MANKNKAEIIIKKEAQLRLFKPVFFLFFAIILSLSVGVAVISMLNAGVKKSDADVVTVYIRTESDLADALNSKVMNDEYLLMNDITIEGDKISSGNTSPLIGTFNGQGHTITVSGGMSTPLFKQVDGTVKFLNVADVDVSGGAAIITETNNGHIENVSVTNAEISVVPEAYTAGIASLNFGSINNCVVSVTFILKSTVTSGRQYVGGAAGMNYASGSIKNTLVSVSFSDDFIPLKNPLFGQNETNDKIGYAVGKSVGITEKLYAFDCKYMNTAADIKAGITENMALSSVTVGFVITTLSFSADRWTANDGLLPSLKVQVQ